MSWTRKPLNLWLRLTQRTFLARVQEPERLRRDFEFKARLFFHAPRGTRAVPEDIAGVPCLRVTCHPEGGPLLLYLHGGAYVFGAPGTHKAMLAQLALLTGSEAVLPDYRKAPEHAFPGAVEDALAVYSALADHPQGVIIGGDSAGGGLALALLAQILADGLPKPRALFAFSPLTDLTFSGASITENAASDVILPAERVDETADMYLQGGDATDPRASPLFADFSGAPPVWLAAGTTEILLDDTRRMADRLRAQGVDVTEVIEHDLPHVWTLFHNLLPEGRATLRDLADWISSRPPRPAGS